MLLLHEIATLYPSNNYKKDDIDFNLFEIILNDIKNKSSMVLEIGMDSDDNIYKKGNSLKMWRGFFTNNNKFHKNATKIIGVDTNITADSINFESIKKTLIQNESNIITFMSKRSSIEDVLNIIKMTGTNINFICDNGKNLSEILLTFSVLKTCLLPGGVYIFKNIPSDYYEYFENASIFLEESENIKKDYKLYTHNKSQLIIVKNPTPPIIPIVIIAWNNLFFVSNFINQIKKFQNPIIILDNNSSYKRLLEYYVTLKEELNEKITIYLLDKNYGHNVYEEKKHLLPDIFIMSDPDLELNENMPINFTEQLLEISIKYKKQRVGLAIKIPEREECMSDELYDSFGYESSHFDIIIQDDNDYKLYQANIDTTFCLINTNYKQTDRPGNEILGIRVGGVFTAKHLPWYKNYIHDNISKDELDIWKRNNKSSSILPFLHL